MGTEFELRIKDSLKHNLKALRKSKKISQEELSSRCGIHRVSIARYETGLQLPSIVALFAMADALNVNIGRLIKVI